MIQNESELLTFIFYITVKNSLAEIKYETCNDCKTVGGSCWLGLPENDDKS